MVENLKSNYWKLLMEGLYPTANRSLMIEHYLYFKTLSIQGAYSILDVVFLSLALTSRVKPHPLLSMYT